MDSNFVSIEKMLKQDSVEKLSQDSKGSSPNFKPLKPQETENQPSNTENHTVSEPRLSIIKEGNRVKTIVLQCACGREYSLNCVYTIPPA
jgi:hypothetical protein